MFLPALSLLAAGADVASTADPLVVFEQACMRGAVRLNKSTTTEIAVDQLPKLGRQQRLEVQHAHHYKILGANPFFLTVGEIREGTGAVVQRVCRVVAERVKVQDGYDAVLHAGSSPPYAFVEKVPNTVRSFQRISPEGFTVSFDATSGRWTVLQSIQLSPAEGARQAQAINQCKDDRAKCQLLRDEIRKH